MCLCVYDVYRTWIGTAYHSDSIPISALAYHPRTTVSPSHDDGAQSVAIVAAHERSFV